MSGADELSGMVFALRIAVPLMVTVISRKAARRLRADAAPVTFSGTSDVSEVDRSPQLRENPSTGG
jgi:hypothetical protein